MTEQPDNHAQQLWQSQPVEGATMSADAIRLRAGKLERSISRMNLREYIASALAVAAFAYLFATAHNTPFRITWALWTVSMIFLAVQLYRKASPKTMPADMGQSSCLDFFRSELERNRDLLKSVWAWYLGPMVPGFIAYNFAYLMTIHRPHAWIGLAVTDVIFAATFIGVWQLNARAARCLQRSIDELTANN